MEAAGRKEKMKKKGKEKKARRLEHLGEGEEEDEEEEEQEEEEGQVQALVRAEFEGEEAKEMKKAKEDLGVKEEALRAPYGREDLKGGGPTVDSGSLHEDRDKEDEDELADEIADGKLDKDKDEGKKRGVLLKEEALRAPYELEERMGGGSPVDSGSLHEVSCIPSSLFFPLASSTHACVASSHEAAMGVADKTEKGKGKEEGVLSLKHRERESQQEPELQAPEASHTVPPGSKNKTMVSLSQQLFHGRQDSERREIRLGLPSNGRMVDETLSLLKDCGLPVERDSPQQYIATIPQLPNLRVFFQHSEEIVRNLSSGHLDIGIVGFDMVSECRQGNDDLIIVHNDLGYGHCHLSLAIPKNGIFERINSVKELAQMPQWTEENPLRVVTGLPNLGNKFMKENGLKHVSISTARGPLEAAPARDWADVILDLVSSGSQTREDNLKEIEGGTVLETQAVLVASRKSLVQHENVRDTTHEILERLEAHLKADGEIMVTAYMSGSSVEEVAERVLRVPSLSGLQNPAICQVFCQRDGKMVVDCYAIDICVPEKALYSSVQQLRAMGSRRVLISPSSGKRGHLQSKLKL